MKKISEKQDIHDYPFEKNDFIHYFKTLYKDRGVKSFYQFLNRPHRRSFSRRMINQFSPNGIGLEVGVGARTIAPTNRTILSDAYDEHGVHDSIAKIFFTGDIIPYTDESLSFVLTEHVLEHLTDPIKTLKEFLRVLEIGGHLYIFLPHHKRTNDHFRTVTSLKHLQSDHENKIKYDDDFHFDDWWNNVVDKGLMPPHYKHLEKSDLLKTCSIHHHVWSDKEICELLISLGIEVVYSTDVVHDRRDSFLVIGKKISNS